MQFKIFKLLGIFLLVGLNSCKKEESLNQLNVNYIHDNPETIALPEKDWNKIKALFEFNNLEYSNYIFYNLQTDELMNHHVRCYQFINNLKIFTGSLIFHFDKNDNFYFLTGDLINKIDLNTKPSMNQNDLRDIYLSELTKASINFHKLNIAKNGINIEFGYYDLNIGISNVNQLFTKAWKVKPQNTEYPFIFVDDNTSKIIYYENGIRY